MCGIGAIFTLPGNTIPASYIHQMMDLMKHRGPDDEGYLCHTPDTDPLILGGDDSSPEIWRNRYPHSPDSKIAIEHQLHQVLMGHRRLSIVDLSVAGHQPFCSEDKRYWIAYNGEVYNFKEIRKDLISLGFSFFSDSDTEVILKSYIAWGKDCLSRFNGMWGFVIYDTEKSEIFIARDRFGVKPLYFWYSQAGFFAIASEIKAFTVLPGWNPLLNRNRAYDFLVNGLMDHTDETLFTGVYQLRGGHLLNFSLDAIGSVLPERWYNPVISREFREETHSIQHFLTLLNDAVFLRMRADVPVGSCLSGGLDSSSIVCLVSRYIADSGQHQKQVTISSTSIHEQWSEKQYSDLVIHSSPIDGHYVYPEYNSLINDLDNLIWHQDEPFGSSSIFAQWSVFQSASSAGMKVMLDGQGADEILYGYSEFVYPVCCELLKKLKILRLFEEIRCASKKMNLSLFHIIGKVMYYVLPDGVRLFFSSTLLKSKYVPPWIEKKLSGGLDLSTLISLIPISSDPHILSKKALFETSLPMLLHWEDRNSMAYSIESRVPFTDYRIVEMALSLPSYFKWRRCISKWILRESMNGIIPEKIRTRQDKMGFVTPEENWMTKENPELFKQMLTRAVKNSHGILSEKIIDEFENVLNNSKGFNHSFWRMIVFSRWMDVFGVQVDENQKCGN